MRGLRLMVRAALVGGAAAMASGCSCEKDEPGDTQKDDVITVVRVESSSPEQPGAEHCDDEGKNCQPLAPQQKIAPRGIVRTFFGGKVSLDWGDGRRIDLGSNSETKLSRGAVDLARGDFSLDSNPLVQKETLAPLKIHAAGRALSTDPKLPTSSNLFVSEEDTVITVVRGALSGLFPENTGAQAGQSVRLSQNGLFRTGRGGQELPQLLPVVPPLSEFGGLLENRPLEAPRGLGTMTARLPNTDQVRDGVVLSKHHVKVVIYDGYARTEVEEEFENTTPHILEGRYRFPVPGDASLSRLALWVGDELIEGEVLERQRAAAIYKSIVDRPVPRDPALLEWMTGGEMSLKVFPILPRKSRRVVLAYNQALSTEGGQLRYVYPLSLGEGRETKIDDLSISLHVADSRSKLSRPRVAGYEASIGREGRFFTATVALKDVTPRDDFVFSIDREVQRSAQISTYIPSAAKQDDTAAQERPAALQSSPPKTDAFGHFALRLSADLPEGFARPAAARVERAIVIDVSQSQSRGTILAQGALAYAMLRDLSPDERYVLLACDSSCATFPEQGMMSASLGHLERARDFLLELLPGGSSDIAGALAHSSLRLNQAGKEGKARRQLVVMSDGQASSGELTAATIAQKVSPLLADLDVRLVAAGRTVDEDLLRGLASRFGAPLDSLESTTALHERLLELSLSLRQPVLENVRISLPSHLRSEDALTISALRLGEEIIVTGELESAAPGAVVVSATLEGAPYQLTLPVEMGGTAQNPLVPRLWARSEISRLQAREETPELRARIVELSRKFRTMSRHTSFLVLESEKMYADFGVERTSLSKSDQPDASFEDVRYESSRDDREDAPPISSFEELADEEAESAPGSRQQPRPVAAAAPAKPMAKRPSGGGGPSGIGNSEADWGLGEGLSSASRGSGAPRESADVDKKSESTDVFPPRMRPPAFFPQPTPRRAHLVFTKADDAWRSWGEKNIDSLRERLAEDPQSRARLEAFIRGHLQHGRFDVAQKSASDFVAMDPDYAPARQLLAFASVVAGDHETARKMLDIHVERAPRSAAGHIESARSFEVVGDETRACAHYRSLAELTPDVKEAAERAVSCWSRMLGQGGAGVVSPEEGKPGQLSVRVECTAPTEPGDCPSPVVIAPDGRVLSPWTPGVGKSSRAEVTFVKLRTGDYYVLILGGAPSSKGKVTLTGRHENQVFVFDRGGMHTIAKVQVAFY